MGKESQGKIVELKNALDSMKSMAPDDRVFYMKQIYTLAFELEELLNDELDRIYRERLHWGVFQNTNQGRSTYNFKIQSRSGKILLVLKGELRKQTF